MIQLELHPNSIRLLTVRLELVCCGVLHSGDIPH